MNYTAILDGDKIKFTYQSENGRPPVFGPAARALPQLPLAIDGEGFVVAQSDFHEPIGPSYWTRP